MYSNKGILQLHKHSFKQPTDISIVLYTYTNKQTWSIFSPIHMYVIV